MTCEIEIQGVRVAVRYPDNMEAVVACGLQGTDYPPIAVPDFDPGIVVDVGANVGATALCFLKRFPGATVHCFEPSGASLPYLRQNTAAFDGIVCHDFGLLDRDGEASIHPGSEQCAQTSLYHTNTTEAHGEPVRLRRASAVVRELELARIGVLKVDTEGSEVPILRDLLLPEPVCRMDMIYVEYHSEEDRVEIDSLLSSAYWLGHARATKVHRGTLGYVHPRCFEGHEEVFYYRILRDE